jgi:hypothetical protein
MTKAGDAQEKKGERATRVTLGDVQRVASRAP